MTSDDKCYERMLPGGRFMRLIYYFKIRFLLQGSDLIVFLWRLHDIRIKINLNSHRDSRRPLKKLYFNIMRHHVLFLIYKWNKSIFFVLDFLPRREINISQHCNKPQLFNLQYTFASFYWCLHSKVIEHMLLARLVFTKTIPSAVGSYIFLFNVIIKSIF